MYRDNNFFVPVISKRPQTAAPFYILIAANHLHRLINPQYFLELIFLNKNLLKIKNPYTRSLL
jgi:hypothetical protein